MKLHVYAIGKSRDVGRIGRLAEVRNSFRLQEIDKTTGDFMEGEPLGATKAIRDCRGAEDSFRWTYRCTGCGVYIRTNITTARITIPGFVPEGQECHFSDSEKARIVPNFPKSIPDALKKYFGNGPSEDCWAGVPCVETQDPTHGCTESPGHGY